MKKLIITISLCILVVLTICIVKETGLLFNVAEELYNATPINDVIETDYYYNLLSKIQQQIYNSIYSAIDNELAGARVISESKFNLEDIDSAFRAVLNDNPRFFYVGTSYDITRPGAGEINTAEIKFNYIESDIQNKKIEVEKQAQKIIQECITEDMTDYEKEVAIYNYLAKNISYYEYDNHLDIPASKHALYSALIEKVAVCDGFSKAFKYIMDKLEVETIILTGVLENVPHCWNLVNIANQWYNVDVTSARQKLAGKEEYKVTHVYLNAVDSEMIAYTRDTKFYTPHCNNIEYNYYIMEGLYLDSDYGIDYKLFDIVSNNETDVLEVKINEAKVTLQNLIDALYEIDFNNYKSERVKQIHYNNIGNVYMFIQE